MIKKAAKFVDLLQAKYPNISATWNPPPNEFFDSNPCALVLTSKTNPKKEIIWKFTNGLGNLSIEQTVEEFLEFRGKVLAEF